MARPIRALVVGAGETAVLMHLPVLARLRDQGRVLLVEACDVRMDRADDARRHFGFARASGDAAAAIGRADIDAIYLFGSAQLHHGHGLAALRAGKHLFVEKPIAPSYAQALELAEAARAGGLVAAGGHNRRFYRAFDAIRAQAGNVGWRSAEAVFHKPAFGTPAPFGARTWLGANGIHALDALVFMMGGLPERMTAAAEGRHLFSALMQWPDGAQGVFLCNNAAGARREDYAFHGPGESWRVADDGLRIEKAGRAPVMLDLPAIGDGFDAEHAAFLDAIEQGSEPPHSLSALAPSLFLAELIENGFAGRVRLPPESRSAEPAHLKPAAIAAKSVLVVNPARLKEALATGLLHHPLVALEDIARSPAIRADVGAVILAPGPDSLTPDILTRLPNLMIAGLVGLSFSRYQPDLLLDRGIALANASEAYAESVADFALGLAILGRRRAFLSDRLMRRGGWGIALPPAGWRGLALATADRLRTLAPRGLEQKLLGVWRSTAPRAGLVRPAQSTPSDLRGATVGLIGWGASARAFARRLCVSGARVLVHSGHGTRADMLAAGAAPASLGEVLAADIVSLHRGLTAATRHGLGARELDRLRPGATLINVARGALIDPGALLARLRRGDIFACLDTFDEEPLAPRHPLRTLPNVFLTSHIAGGSPGMHAAAAREVIGKIAAHLDGESVDVLSRERLATMT